MTTDRQEKRKTLNEIREKITETSVRLAELKKSIETGEAILEIMMHLEKKLEDELFGEE